jgi:ubiquinone/menaquinone biosynthesis C-methylase UbiE
MNLSPLVSGLMLSSVWRRLKRKPAQLTTPAAGELRRSGQDYRSAWEVAAQVDAQSTVLTASSAEYFEWTGKRDAARVREYLSEAATVLSIGCGIGRVERYLAPHVGELWAIDVSAEMLRRAEIRLSSFPNVRLREVGNADFLKSFDGCSFDLVFSYLVLQHLEKEDAERYIAEARRVLKAGGVLVAQFPNYLAREYARVLLDDVEPDQRSPARVRPYTETEVRQTLDILGFEILDLHLEWGEQNSAEIYVAARPKL